MNMFRYKSNKKPACNSCSFKQSCGAVYNYTMCDESEDNEYEEGEE